MGHSLVLLLALQTAGAGPSLDDHLQRGLIALLASQTEEVPGWPWEKAGPAAVSNLGGVIALSLLDLWERTRDPGAWVTLVQYADHLRTAYAADAVLPFKADIEFLARAGELGLDEEGRAFAQQLFARIKRLSPRGGDEYARIAKGRASIPEVVGYDIALAIRAALAVGDRTYAGELADAALGAGRLSLTEPDNSLQVTSVGALLHALARLDRATDRRRLALTAADIARAQAPQGSWGVNDTQATAYAVLGLRANAAAPGAGDAAARGETWLLNAQLRAGDWPEYHDGMPEPFVGTVRPLVHAEALAALSARP